MVAAAAAAAKVLGPSPSLSESKPYGMRLATTALPTMFHC